MEKFSGADWIKRQSYGKNISSLGELVADILGQVYNGIYHIEDRLNKVDWKHPRAIEIKIDQPLATFDFSHLTVLIVLCFDNMLRLKIKPINSTLLGLVFSKRKKYDGDISTGLPLLDDFVKEIREKYSIEKVES